MKFFITIILFVSCVCVNAGKIQKAIKAGDLKLVKELVSGGTDVSKASYFSKQTPLHLALEQNQSAIVVFLIKSGANIRTLNRQKLSSVHIISQQGDLDIFRLVYKYPNFSINKVIDHSSVNGHLAFMESMFNMASKRTLKEIAHYRHKTEGLRLLNVLCRYGQVATGRLLLHLNLELRNYLYQQKEGKTPRHKKSSLWDLAESKASESACVEFARLLIGYGAKTNTFVRVGESSYSYMDDDDPFDFYPFEQVKKSRRFLKNVLNPNSQGEFIRIDLHRSAHLGTEEAVLSLLSNKRIKVNRTDGLGKTPLHHAAANCIPLLIKAGAKVNIQDRYGWTPLHWATHWADVDRVRELLKAGADPKIKNKKGQMPIWFISRDYKTFEPGAFTKPIVDLLNNPALAMQEQVVATTSTTTSVPVAFSSSSTATSTLTSVTPESDATSTSATHLR